MVDPSSQKNEKKMSISEKLESSLKRMELSTKNLLKKSKKNLLEYNPSMPKLRQIEVRDVHSISLNHGNYNVKSKNFLSIFSYIFFIWFSFFLYKFYLILK